MKEERTDDKLHGQDRDCHGGQGEDCLICPSTGEREGQAQLREVCWLAIRKDVLVVIQACLDQENMI